MRPPLIPQPIPFHGNEQPYIKLLKLLYNTLVEYRDPQTGRIIISIFMCLPSRKDFPEYFEIIKRPISMYEIRKRIENGYYASEEPCLNDFRLMFNNCRTFNEDGSMIFQDAVRLEEIFFDKYDQYTQDNQGKVKRLKTSRSPAKSPPSVVRTDTQPQVPHNNNNNITNNINNINSTNSANSINNINNSNNNNINNNSINNQLPASQQQQQPLQGPSIPNGTSTPKEAKIPKKRLLTGYIIYAAEVRKEYVDKHPNEDFGFISRLIGNDWKALPKDLRTKYDQRALVHNKKAREKALRDSMSNPSLSEDVLQTPHGLSMTNGTSTPRLTKKRLAKLAKEQARLNKSSTPHLNHDNTFASPMRQPDRPSQMTTHTSYPSYRASSDNRRFSHSTQQGNYGQQNMGKLPTVESATQTAPFRFVEPPIRKRFVYAENFKRYIEGLGVPNMDLLAEETACLERPSEPLEGWLGGGTGRHGSTEEALWALRDFILLHSDTMRMNLQPYLCYQ